MRRGAIFLAFAFLSPRQKSQNVVKLVSLNFDFPRRKALSGTYPVCSAFA
jgi:hypothetical protein